MEEVELPLNFRFKAKNPYYTVVVWEFLFQQRRIQLLKWDPIDLDGDGVIVREACTYDLLKAIQIKDAICQADDPEGYMESLATKDNCEGPGMRIQLDNKPGDR